jgi:hypothetical protein
LGGPLDRRDCSDEPAGALLLGELLLGELLLGALLVGALLLGALIAALLAALLSRLGTAAGGEFVAAGKGGGGACPIAQVAMLKLKTMPVEVGLTSVFHR